MSEAIEVYYRVDDDAIARQVGNILHALGHKPVRAYEADGVHRFDWAARLAKTYDLTDRETTVLRGVFDGDTNATLADAMGISRASVKWYLHSAFSKTKTNCREDLLRLALRTGSAR